MSEHVYKSVELTGSSKKGIEDAVRNAISLGGDSDTLACITGAIGEACYGPVAPHIIDNVKTILPRDLWVITEKFCRQYGPM